MQLITKLRVFFLKVLPGVVLVALVKSGRFIRTLFSKQSIIKIKNQFSDPNQTDEFKALSAAFGIFVGIIPVWGLQTVIAIFAAMIFKLNKPLVLLFSQISFPPLLPFVVMLSYNTGSLWMPPGAKQIAFKMSTPFANMSDNLQQYLYGSFMLALLAAVVTGLATLAILKLIKVVKTYGLPVFKRKYVKQAPPQPVL
jgi:uncharacterized protein (DUF2062 family)